MKDLLRFCLTGCGYLEGLTTEEGEVSARIRVMQTPFAVDNDGLEEVILNCQVDTSKWLLLFLKLEELNQRGHSIIIKFKAAYSHFGYCHTGISPDPEQMVQLCTQLLDVEGWYQDGCYTNTNHSEPPQVMTDFSLEKAA